MSRLIRWITLLLTLGASSGAFSQTSLSSGYCDLGAAKALLRLRLCRDEVLGQ